MTERPIQFASGAEELCGIMHLPDAGGPARDLGFVFVHGGSRGRLANTFQYPFYARRLAQLGYPSLRFDPAGIGDSTGTIDTCHAGDFYGSIQAGRFVSDTLRAIEALKREAGPRGIILFGLCGGAITSLLTAARSKDVVGLVLLSTPVIQDCGQQDWLERLPADHVRKRLGVYARKLLSPTAWRRLLTHQSETDTIWTLLKVALRGRPSTRPGFNPRFLAAVDAVVARGAKVLFLFGDDDGFRRDFDRQFRDVYWSKAARYQRHCQIHYLPRCNHMFSLREWQRTALDLTEHWISSHPG